MVGPEAVMVVVLPSESVKVMVAVWVAGSAQGEEVVGGSVFVVSGPSRNPAGG